MSCLTDHDLERWSTGRLPPAEQATVMAHVDDCAACREIVAALAREQPDMIPAPSRADAVEAASARYALAGELVRGGMGRILRAHDRVLDREVALKCPHGGAAAIARFSREVALLGRLAHPSIVAVHDAGWLGPELPFFAMPLLRGEPLDRRLARPATPAERLGLVRRLLPMINAVAYAHGEGIVHRDIKPQNIFLGEFEECLLLDWGLATDLGASPPAAPGASPPAAPGAEAPATARSAAGVTQIGQGMGTRGYSSPEQLRGEAADPRADIYSLGAVLYHALAGEPPADPARPLAEVAPAVPRELASVVMRALADAPEARYPRTGDLAAELDRFFAGLLVAAHRYTPAERARRWLRRYRAWVAAVAVTLAAIAISATVAWRSITRERDVAVRERAEALRARHRSQALTSFLLVDVQDKLDDVGRLDLMADLAAGVAEFATPADQLPAVAASHDDGLDLVNQVRISDLLGDVALARAEYRDALAHYRQSADLLDRAEAADAVGAGARCRTLLRLGDAHRGLGDDAAAAAAFGGCAPLAGVEAATAADRDRIADVLAQSRIALADLARDHGKPGEARSWLDQALVALQPARPRVDPRLARSARTFETAILQRIGTSHRMDGDYAAAARAFERAVAAARGNVAAAPGDLEARRTLVATLTSLGQIKRNTGEADGLDAVIGEALALAEPAYAADRSDSTAARQLNRLWALAAEGATGARQRALLGKAVDVSRGLLAAAPDAPSAMLDLMSDLIGLCDAHAAAGRAAEAAAVCAEATALARRRRAALPADGAETELLIALLHDADVDDLRGRGRAAHGKRAEAVGLARGAVTTAPSATAAYWHAVALLLWMTPMPRADRAALADELDRAVTAVEADGNEAFIAEVRERLAELRARR